jgi:protein-tyrosine phosphatase
LSSPEGPDRLDAFHWAFDKAYPAIRFTYERLLGHAWFSQITPRLWLGGAPTYRRDYEALIADGITAVLDVRAERTTDLAFYDAQGISHQRLHVPDIGVPDEDQLTEAIAWIDAQLADGRTVLVHCAKGRGRSATVLAAYLMRTDGMSFDEASRLLRSKRSLVKLEARHRRVLESWIATRPGHRRDESQMLVPEEGFETPRPQRGSGV